LIGLLKGIASDELDGSVLVEVNGVGYEVSMPLGALGRAARDERGEVTLHVHTHVREDALDLYAFASREERSAFRTLIGVSKVGPKLALAVLGALSVGELAKLCDTGQIGPLTRVPGVGKKTAERLALELKGKLTGLAGDGAPALAARRPAAPSGQASVLQDALVRMGFKPAEAERAVATLVDLDKPMGELIREALAVLSP
jgi:Holliday junction DNA helicase RuvA